MTKKTIYGIIRDGDDGSASLEWHSNKDKVERLLNPLDYDPETYDDEYYLETYAMNEGSPAVTLTVDEDFDFKAAGIYYINNN